MKIGAPVTDTKSSTSFADLPSEMIVEILSRLPVKTLIRSTSVNKSWYSLIINPKFFTAQIHRSISCCDENAVFIIPAKLCVPRDPCALFSVEKCSVIESFQVPFTTKSGTVKIVGSHNGLLCLTDVSLVHMCRDLYLWNPSVRRYKTLVSSCFKDVVGDWNQRYCVVGLGFHEPTDDYRIVRMVYPYGDESNKVPAKVEIFSVKKNTWRKLKNPVVPRIAKPGGVFVDRSVYWLEAKEPAVYFEELWILSFDFGDEVFGELKLPDKVRHSLGRGETANFSLMKIEGSVAVCVFEMDLINEAKLPCYVWVMSHEDGVLSWTRHLRVVMDVFGWPLQITKSGTVILESWHKFPNYTLVSCDLKNMHYTDLGFSGPTDASDFNMEILFMLTFGQPCNVDTSFIETLVLLEGGNALLTHPK